MVWEWKLSPPCVRCSCELGRGTGSSVGGKGTTFGGWDAQSWALVVVAGGSHRWL